MSNKKNKTLRKELRKELRKKLSGISAEKSVLERDILNEWMSMSIRNRLILAFRIIRGKKN